MKGKTLRLFAISVGICLFRSNHTFIFLLLYIYVFRFDEEVGHGKFKTVFKAFDETKGVDVAWGKIYSDRVSLPPHIENTKVE